jgi:hypothetical protein
MGLEHEIEVARREIKTDAYAMSIGELVNLYRDEEMEIAPEFQRLFRWSVKQKSRFIESILLGIPLPSIFVAARKDGTWEVVDGLQRLSTILQFMGELRLDSKADEDWKAAVSGLDEDGGEDDGDRAKNEPLVLKATKYLPSLEGKTWDGNGGTALTSSQRLLIKRAKMDVKIIDRDSSPESKYELFQRLNTGGSPLSDQEVRNVLLLMHSRERFRWVFELSQSPEFQGSLSLSERLFKERYDMELVFRFVAYMNSSDDDLKQFDDVGVFLDEWAGRIGEFTDGQCASQGSQLKSTFGLIQEAFGSDGFRRYSLDEHEFKGPFSVSAFEAISVGVGRNLDAWINRQKEQGSDAVRDVLRDRIEQLWGHEVFKRRARSGVTASGRVPYTVPLARKLFR